MMLGSSWACVAGRVAADRLLNTNMFVFGRQTRRPTTLLVRQGYNEYYRRSFLWWVQPKTINTQWRSQNEISEGVGLGGMESPLQVFTSSGIYSEIYSEKWCIFSYFKVNIVFKF